jgi:hypothetical protein
MTVRYLRDQIPGDQRLVSYLIGRLSAEDVERMDELSIVDDAVAERLRVVEEDLVDAYVVGSLEGDILLGFESVYLDSPLRREKVALARRFLRAIDRQAAAPRIDEQPADAQLRVRTGSRKSAWRRMGPVALLSAAAMVLLTCGTLFFQSTGLRRDLMEARRDGAASAGQATTLAGLLEEERAANAALSKDLEARRAVAASPSVAIVLAPQTRGDAMATLALQPATTVVPLALKLDRDARDEYLVSLEDLVTNRVVWRSEIVSRDKSRHPRTVSLDVPARVLKPRHYLLELTPRHVDGGAAAGGVSYVFNVESR